MRYIKGKVELSRYRTVYVVGATLGLTKRRKMPVELSLLINYHSNHSLRTAEGHL
jgi:hypothetical protein